MGNINIIKACAGEIVRHEWNEEEQDWYLSIVDVIGVLTDQPTHDGARKYWSVLKSRLKKEGNELTTICSQLKMQSTDGKFLCQISLDKCEHLFYA